VQQMKVRRAQPCHISKGHVPRHLSSAHARIRRLSIAATTITTLASTQPPGVVTATTLGLLIRLCLYDCACGATASSGRNKGCKGCCSCGS
jgi:hypothetical protein